MCTGFCSLYTVYCIVLMGVGLYAIINIRKTIMTSIANIEATLGGDRIWQMHKCKSTNLSL